MAKPLKFADSSLLVAEDWQDLISVALSPKYILVIDLFRTTGNRLLTAESIGSYLQSCTGKFSRINSLPALLNKKLRDADKDYRLLGEDGVNTSCGPFRFYKVVRAINIRKQTT